MKKQGRSPVIACRVPEPLHRRIKASARTAKQSMSEHMAVLLGRAFDWQDAFEDRVKMLEECKAETARIANDDLAVTLKRKGWQHDRVTGHWLPPDIHGLPPSGFMDEQARAIERVSESAGMAVPLGAAEQLEAVIERVVERAMRNALGKEGSSFGTLINAETEVVK